MRQIHLLFCRHFFLSFFIFTVFVISVFDANGQSVKLLSGPDFQIALVTDMTIVRIPIDIEGDSTRLRLINVTFENPLKTVPPDAFAAQIETDSFKNSFIKISINNLHRIDYGKYNLLFNALKLKSGTPDRITLSLTVKAATLVPPGPVIMARSQCVPLMPYKISKPTLTLFETSREAIVSSVSIRTISLKDDAGKDVPAAVKFLDTDQVIRNGRQGDFPFDISGDLPLGTVEGTFEIKSPQLAPVQFTMKIVTKRTGIWIVLAIVLGLALGYIIRILLKNLLERKQAQKTLLDLVVLLNIENAARPDKTFTAKINIIKSELNLVFEKGTTEITTAIDTAKKSLTDAVSDFNTRRTTLDTSLKAFSAAINGIWFLPEEIKSILVTATKNITAVNSEITGNNPEQGDTLLTAAKNDLATNLKTAVLSIKNDLLNTYEKIKTSPFKLLLSNPVLSEELAALITTANTLSGSDFDKDVANIRTQLELMDAQRIKTRNFYFHFALATRSLLENIKTILINGNVDLINELSDLLKKTDEKMFLKSDAELDQLMDNTATVLEGIQNELYQVFTTSKLNLTNEQTNAIKADFTKGSYADAATKIVEFKKPATVAENALANDTRSQAPLSGQIPFPINHNTGFIVNPGMLGGFTNSNPMMIDDDNIYVRLNQTISRIEAVQSILICIVITVFGYALFVDKFTGTTADLIEVFSWAFILNVSLETLATVASGIPKRIRA